MIIEKKYELEIYESINGQRPFIKWLESLTLSVRSRIQIKNVCYFVVVINQLKKKMSKPQLNFARFLEEIMKKNKSSSYEAYLIESLKDPKEAESYLNAALEDGDIQVFLLALQHVIQAHGGVAKLAKESKKSRTSLYKALSKKGNPYLKNTASILKAIGMHFCVRYSSRNVKLNSLRQR